MNFSLFRERGRKLAARVFRRQLAHFLGFLRNQSGMDEWIRGITLARVGPTCEHQLFLDGVSHQLGVKWQSSDFII